MPSSTSTSTNQPSARTVFSLGDLNQGRSIRSTHQYIDRSRVYLHVHSLLAVDSTLLAEWEFTVLPCTSFLLLWYMDALGHIQSREPNYVSTYFYPGPTSVLIDRLGPLPLPTIFMFGFIKGIVNFHLLSGRDFLQVALRANANPLGNTFVHVACSLCWHPVPVYPGRSDIRPGQFWVHWRGKLDQGIRFYKINCEWSAYRSWKCAGKDQPVILREVTALNLNNQMKVNR